MPTLGTLCYFHLFPSLALLPQHELYWRLIVAMLAITLFLPLLSVFFMIRIGRVSTMFIEEQRERSWPLLMTAIIYCGALWLFRTRVVPGFIWLFLLGAVISMVLALLINLRWKISLHMIGIGGLCGGLTMLYYLSQEGSPMFLAAAFLLAGLLGTARLILNAHTPMQLLAGFALGFASEVTLALMAS